MNDFIQGITLTVLIPGLILGLWLLAMRWDSNSRKEIAKLKPETPAAEEPTRAERPKSIAVVFICLLVGTLATFIGLGILRLLFH